MAEPLREPGWWRLTESGWVRVPDDVAKLEVAAGDAWNLVHVEVKAAEEIPLF